MTRGEQIAEAVRAYLFTNGLKQSQLTGAVLAELADRVLAHADAVAKKKKRLASEEDWIKELEKEPHLAGVDVRKELAAAQFWCKNNDRQCVRRFFVNWLNRAERSAVISPGGGKPEINRKDVYAEPPNWREVDATRIMRALSISAETWANICTWKWPDLSTDIRATILKAL